METRKQTVSTKGLYFFAFFNLNTRAVSYTKRDILRKLKEAMLEIPEQLRPVLFACPEHKLFYIHQPEFAGSQNDLIAIRSSVPADLDA
jgi:hypothetical protein